MVESMKTQERRVKSQVVYVRDMRKRKNEGRPAIKVRVVYVFISIALVGWGDRRHNPSRAAVLDFVKKCTLQETFADAAIFRVSPSIAAPTRNAAPFF